MVGLDSRVTMTWYVTGIWHPAAGVQRRGLLQVAALGAATLD
jgi:hypothetical protein